MKHSNIAGALEIDNFDPSFISSIFEGVSF